MEIISLKQYLPVLFSVILASYITMNWIKVCVRGKAKEELDKWDNFHNKYGLGIIRLPEWLHKLLSTIGFIVSWFVVLVIILDTLL